MAQSVFVDLVPVFLRFVDHPGHFPLGVFAVAYDAAVPENQGAVFAVGVQGNPYGLSDNIF